MALAPAIECSGAGYRVDGHRWVLRAIDLVIERGERVAILGPNGAGKTSLLHMFVGIRAVSEGTIGVAGLPVAAGNLREIRRGVGLVFQEPDDQLFCATVYEDVAFGLRQQGVPEVDVRRRVDEALAAVDMASAAGSVSHHLSTGQKRRASLAAVLVMTPSVLLLDEPTNDLDPRGRRSLEAILAGCRQTLVIASHDLEFVLRTCNRGVLLDDARVVADGPIRQLLADRGLMEGHGLEVPASLALALEHGALADGSGS